jgi:hypothetical protein
MMDRLRATSVHLWFSRFVKQLDATHRAVEPAIPMLPPAVERTVKSH